MAGLTKDELKSALVSHGVETNLSAAKKDELVQLYEEFVAPHEDAAGEFSSDDEIPVKNTSRRSSRRVSGKVATPRVSEKAPAETPLQKSPRVSAKAATPRVSAKAATPRVSEKAPEEVILRKSPRVSAKAPTPRVSAKAPTPRVSAKANGDAKVDVNELNDEELLENLKKHGIEVGPIVGMSFCITTYLLT